MAAAGDKDPDAVLSDVEEDDPVSIAIAEPSPDDLSVERFRELMAELHRERQARTEAENSKSELEAKLSRLKALAHEVIKKRDECARERDEALREKEELLQWKEKLSVEFSDANSLKEEALSQKDQIARQLDDAVKAKDNLRSEIETSAHMLVTGIEKISGKVSNFKNFSAGGLPRSQKYAGLAAVAYGVIKRTNEIVEELVRQINVAEKSRNEAREQMEQRNYEIAIEVSQLEAAISGLKEEITKKSSALESLEKAVGEKDVKVADTERLMMEKVNLLEKENSELREFAGEIDDKLNSLELRMEALRPFLNEQLDFVSKIHEKACDVIKIVDACSLNQLDLSESLFLPQETEVEESIHASLAGMKSTYELIRVVVEKTQDVVDEKNLEIKGINETVDRLMKEKEQIGSLLRSTLSKRIALDSSSRTNELFQVAENGLREAGIEFKFSKHLGDNEVPAATKVELPEKQEDEIYSLVSFYFSKHDCLPSLTRLILIFTRCLTPNFLIVDFSGWCSREYN